MFVCNLCIIKWRKCQANASFITKSRKVSVFFVVAQLCRDQGIICSNFVYLAGHLVELVIFAFPTGEG